MHRRTPILFTRVKFAYLRALEKIRDRGNPPLVKAKIPLIFLADHDIYFIAKPGQNKQIQNLFLATTDIFLFLQFTGAPKDNFRKISVRKTI